MYLIQEIHRFIGQAKTKSRIIKSESPVKKKKSKRRKDKKKKSKKKQEGQKRDITNYNKDSFPKPRANSIAKTCIISVRNIHTTPYLTPNQFRKNRRTTCKSIKVALEIGTRSLVKTFLLHKKGAILRSHI